MYLWQFGWGVLFNIALACITALCCEALALKLRQRNIAATLSDKSALVTAVLLALCLPSLAPWWLPILGAAFAILLAKHLYGGLGFNPFNPAMVAYVILLISFPQQMTSWLKPDALIPTSLSLSETSSAIFSGQLPNTLTWDAITQATPLDTLRTARTLDQNTLFIQQDTLFGLIGGAGWEWIAAAYFVGGLWLVIRRVISWHIPAAVLTGLLFPACLFNLINPAVFTSPTLHLFAGATMLGAFFIATDPVTAATSNKGRLVFGFGIGIITYIIRTWGGYPDGFAFAVLLMNLCVPIIDRYTKPRVFGH